MIEPAPDARPAPDRRPALALFAGGLMTGAAAVVLVLTMTGVIGPIAASGPGTAANATAGASQGTAATSTGALVTPPPVVTPASFTPTALAHGRALGDAGAPLTIEIWADYQCPYCARFSAQVEPQIVAQYVATGKARLVFRDLAFLGDESRWAAVAARLAEQQDRFWPFHDYLFANQLGENAGSYTPERLKEIASRVGLDRATFDAGLELAAARTVFAQIQEESQADATRLGIRSTPTVVVDGKPLTGNDWTTVKAAIDAALAG